MVIEIENYLKMVLFNYFYLQERFRILDLTYRFVVPKVPYFQDLVLLVSYCMSIAYIFPI